VNGQLVQRLVRVAIEHAQQAVLAADGDQLRLAGTVAEKIG